MSNLIPADYYMDMVGNVEIAMEHGDAKLVDDALYELDSWVKPELDAEGSATYERVYQEALSFGACSFCKKHGTGACVAMGNTGETKCSSLQD